MKSQSELLIESLTGRRFFTLRETLELQEISLFEGKGDTEKTEKLIKQFKKRYVLTDDEWLC